MFALTDRSCTALAIAGALGLAISGCSDAGSDTAPAPPPEPPPRAAPPPPPAPEEVRANELGDVPVLMYHRITPDPSGVYERTPHDFRAELQRLADEDYVPVTATQFATGDIDIPAGKHPVVLTFDDGASSQFALDPAGEPVQGTAVSILLDVAERNPGFDPRATFYVFNPPFEEPTGKRSLTWLHEHGFEIGNHTANHPNLGQISAPEAQHEIAEMHRNIRDAVPRAQVRSLALPMGMHPDDERLAAAGSADGVDYRYDSVMLVGSNPSSAPHAADFDPENIPRIRSQGPDGEDADYGSTAWLDNLAGDPDSRYTSDGDPNRISAPHDAPPETPGTRVHRY